MRKGAALAVAPAVGALAYWRTMSPYSQACGEFPYRMPTDDRVVALSFDDGPNEPYTSHIADLLERYGARATFFSVG